jgi:sugar lactone lactonase YvrE
MPTGVTVSHHGRIFVNFPLWGDDVPFTVGEVRDGRATAYPDEASNRADGDPARCFVSVQSVVVDPHDRLWIVDTGNPGFAGVVAGGAKIVCVDLAKDRVVRSIPFPPEVALPTSYLNDVRFDLDRGAEGMAFITDSSNSGPNAIVVVDLASGQSWRRLHDHPTTKAEPLRDFRPLVEGRPFLERGPDGTVGTTKVGADGIAISADGTRLYYCPLASRRLYSVATNALADRTLDDAAVAQTIQDEGDKGGAADGLESDAAGNIYATNYEHDAITRRRPDGQWETVAHDPRLLWPDTLCVAGDGYLYVIANQIHRMKLFLHEQDLRHKPYMLFRVRIDAKPVRLSRRSVPQAP